MIIKGITDEDFVNYKVPSMFIAMASCSFKCDTECGQSICQNSFLAKQPDIDIPMATIIDRYRHNQITHAIVFGGLEPMDQFSDVISFIGRLRRSGIGDPVVIYTGYTKEELKASTWSVYFEDTLWAETRLDCIEALRHYGSIIMKYGRFIPGQNPHFDPVLGVNLASDNQYAELISE